MSSQAAAYALPSYMDSPAPKQIPLPRFAQSPAPPPPVFVQKENESQQHAPHANSSSSSNSRRRGSKSTTAAAQPASPSQHKFAPSHHGQASRRPRQAASEPQPQPQQPRRELFPSSQAAPAPAQVSADSGSSIYDDEKTAMFKSMFKLAGAQSTTVMSG